MKRSVMVLTLLLGSALTAVPLLADRIDPPSPATMHIVCIAPTVCVSGATSLVTTSSTPTFDLVSEGGAISGEAFLGILVPNGTTSFSVSQGALETSITFSSGHLGDSTNLNEPDLSDYEFSALASASSQAGVTATFFTAYDWNLGPYSSPGGGSPGIINISVGPVPVGTVIVAWLEDASGNAIERTPLSDSLTVTAVPEPASLLLVGTGLLGLGGFIRRRRKA